MLPPVELYYSKSRTLGYVGLSCVMTAASGFCSQIQNTKAFLAGWLGVLFFGGCLVAAILRLFTKKPVIILSEDGLEDIRWGTGAIPWFEIVSIQIETIETRGREHSFLGVRLRNERAYQSKVPMLRKAAFAANRALGFSYFILNCKGLEGELEDVLRVVREYHRVMSAGEMSPAGSGVPSA